MQGAVSVRFQLHGTNLCFVCCHLASGGREGDEKYRNSDVAEIFSRTSFPRRPLLDLPRKILDHEYVKLHYRLSIKNGRPNHYFIMKNLLINVSFTKNNERVILLILQILLYTLQTDHQ